MPAAIATSCNHLWDLGDVGGHLAISGEGPLVQCLLDIPGGIRFQSIEADSCLKDLAKLLMECSSTLEVLNIHCFKDRKPSTFILTYQSTEWLSLVSPPTQRLPEFSVDLGYNGILGWFAFAVDFAELGILPPFLHRTLTSITSPHFSEFSLLLFQRSYGYNYKEGDSRRGISWGTGWEVVDEDLYAHAARRDDFQVVIQIVTGKSTVAAVEALFPRMKSKGSLVITQKPTLRPRW